MRQSRILMLQLMTMKKAGILILLSFSIISCRPSFGLAEETQVGSTDMLCECIEATTPQLNEYSFGVLEYAAENQDADIEEHIEEVRSSLSGKELDEFNQHINYFLENDFDEMFVVCGGPILEEYPELDEMDDEVLVDMFLYNLDEEECEKTYRLLQIYKALNL